jgi:hypothetical protein
METIISHAFVAHEWFVRTPYCAKGRDGLQPCPFNNRCRFGGLAQKVGEAGQHAVDDPGLSERQYTCVALLLKA